jgi:hypothetical protein
VDPMFDFNVNGYTNLLSFLVEEGYTFNCFSEANSTQGKVCLLRHDIDADLNAASLMAKIESTMGISSTYFLMLRSPIYNLFARHNDVYVKNILSLGHQIGLHYDFGFLDPYIDHRNYIDLQCHFLENNFNTKISAVSFHQPISVSLQGQINTGNRINTYSDVDLNSFNYFSDSNRVFTLNKLLENSKRGLYEATSDLPRKIQLLIHPMWWIYDQKSTFDVWNKVIESNFIDSQKQLLETERAYGTKRSINIISG